MPWHAGRGASSGWLSAASVAGAAAASQLPRRPAAARDRQRTAGTVKRPEEAMRARRTGAQIEQLRD